MNNSRRDFLKKAALLTGGAGAWSMLPISIQKALAISPDPETTFYDAEHVVMLMQENRSFDHCFGTLRGVRGFNDPRAISLPNNIPVWLQPDKNGNRFAPFRLDMKDTKATWMGGVPHSWEDQVDARNEGKYDNWIEAKRPGNKEYREMPLTMGYYNREDIPFYYALADSFTVCDQHFCAALTGTTTNRSYFWAGKTHGEKNDKAKVRNGELTYNKEVDWKTFPDRLEDQGISWKVYQNEISLPTDLEDESLLANFTDNNLEWFLQFGARYSYKHYEFLQKRQKQLPEELKKLEAQLKKKGTDKTELSKKIEALKKEITELKDYLKKWNPENFEKLSEREKSLHRKAFTTNSGDPDYNKVEKFNYSDNGVSRETTVPKGDILYQFRKDAAEGNLPTVSWLVAPQKFSDHPSAPWYGAWYISEVLDILTKNPDLWKKTIFILNYDENDGYFDHVPPFVPPNPNNAGSGKISDGLSIEGEFVTLEEEIKAGFKANESRTSPVGLGYRVPLVIASPWTRGGWVNSEVCDITSTIQFLENFLSKKTGKKIEETNISSWRRAISGDLTSAFRPYKGHDEVKLPESVDHDVFVKQIYNAKFKELPNNFKALNEKEVKEILENPQNSRVLPVQETGVKPSNALKYELYSSGELSEDGKYFSIKFRAAKDIFGEESLGAPFNVYAPGDYWNEETKKFEPVKTWAFAVKAGDEIEYKWPLAAFANGQYRLQVYGPNGYFRAFAGNASGTGAVVNLEPIKEHGVYGHKMKLTIKNTGSKTINLLFIEETYQKAKKAVSIEAQTEKSMEIDTAKTKGWYDFSLKSILKNDFETQFAGRLETGKDSISDPFMGRV